MKLVNGWSEEDMLLLCARTGCDHPAIVSFCRAIDKQLYMMLPAHIKRATLHFHLRAHAPEQAPEQAPRTRAERAEDENIVRLQDYLRRRVKQSV